MECDAGFSPRPVRALCAGAFRSRLLGLDRRKSLEYRRATPYSRHALHVHARNPFLEAMDYGAADTEGRLFRKSRCNAPSPFRLVAPAFLSRRSYSLAPHRDALRRAALPLLLQPA